VVVWWQWVRHRTWHYNVQSGRYTPFEEDDFYVPATWRLQSDSNKQGSAGTLDPERSQHWHDTMADLAANSFGLYEEALAEDIAREQARLLLPAWSSYYIAVAKVDSWNLMHFLRLRTASDAQWEIRQYAAAILEIFKQVMPWTAQAFEQYLAKDAPVE
jgi:thymidylate synthase (FAD)